MFFHGSDVNVESFIFIDYMNGILDIQNDVLCCIIIYSFECIVYNTIIYSSECIVYNFHIFNSLFDWKNTAYSRYYGLFAKQINFVFLDIGIGM